MGAPGYSGERIRKYYISGDEQTGEGIYVEWRGQRYGEGPVLWAVTYRGYCFNKEGGWEFEPQPSSRTDAFIARCRYTSLEDAIEEAEDLTTADSEEKA